MSSLSTPDAAAAALFRLLPGSRCTEALADYGLSLSPRQGRRLTEELLALSLFWTRSALEVILSPAGVTRVMDRLRGLIETDLVRVFGAAPLELEAFSRLVEARRDHYRSIVVQGATPVAVASEAAAIWEHEGIVLGTERTKALAFILDQTPVDEVGELAQDIDLEG